MAERKVRCGFIVYTDVDGKPATGYFGDTVDVHKDDLDRFDKLNPEEADVPDTEIAEATATFSQEDIDVAVLAAQDAKDAELAEATKALADEREAFEAEKAEFERVKAEAEKKTTAVKRS
ncbi:MAG: hypothetical protein LBE05_05755 [Microbacterium sp.]|jgi:hypothetical protein|nr:hypothetical protein [Microbacterium sp.]